MGQNPGAGAPNASWERRALPRLKWLVVRDMVETETATFWCDSPRVIGGELQPETIDTEVFFFPAAGHEEKAGCFTNIVQPDVCNGCGYCVVACPVGVIECNPDDGRAFKCTFCYDRQKAGRVPACAKACPTESIRFGQLEDLTVVAQK
jgi:nitrate reductase beta subunit